MRSLPIILALATSGAAAQNDCTTALPVNAGTWTAPVITGTLPQPDCVGGGFNAAHGEWYVYTPDSDLYLTVTTDLPANLNGDTRVHLYTGTCGALTCVSGDDDSGSGYLSIMRSNVHGGQTYYIAFDDEWNSSGFQFQLIEGPVFEAAISFTPSLSAPGLPMGVVDMNGDHLDDVVSPEEAQVTILYQHADGTHTSGTITTPVADHPASWSFCAGDINKDGLTDMMYGSGDGATFMIAGNDGHTFTENSFPQYIFCQRTNLVDLNGDGNLDAFSCHDVDANVYFLNDGTGALTFHQGGLGSDCGNYGSIWVDYDNDGDQDLFIAKCGCDPVDLFMRNEGDMAFSTMAATYGFDDQQQSWSSAWGDFDNDGDMDGLIGSSSGNDHKLMRNDGTGFTNATVGSGFEGFEGASIEWVTHDFNNDGWLDVLGGGALFMNNGDMTFTPLTMNAPTNGPIGDLNNDGFLDIVNGTQVYMNDANANHWLTVTTVGTNSNANGIGARVELTSALGTQIRDVRSGDGFRYMSTLNTHFGLGADSVIENLTIRWPSGLVTTLTDVPVDQPIVVVEGVSTGVNEAPASDLQVYPSPAENMLFVRNGEQLGTPAVRVMDSAGKLVLRGTLRNGTLDVSGLTPGLYLVRIEGATAMQARFIKQ